MPPTVFAAHLRPRFLKDWKHGTDAPVLAQLWDEDIWDFVDSKAKDKEVYARKVRDIFEAAEALEDANTIQEKFQRAICPVSYFYKPV